MSMAALWPSLCTSKCSGRFCGPKARGDVRHVKDVNDPVGDDIAAQQLGGTYVCAFFSSRNSHIRDRGIQIAGHLSPHLVSALEQALHLKATSGIGEGLSHEGPIGLGDEYTGSAVVVAALELDRTRDAANLYMHRSGFA